MIDVLAVPGTTEPNSRDGKPVGMLRGLTDKLDKTKFTPYAVNYPASYGAFTPFPNSPDFTESVERGVQALALRIRTSDNPVFITGYSQGSTVISRLLERIATGLVDYKGMDKKIVGVCLVANPMRALGDSVDITVQGYGISGEHGPWPKGIRVLEIAHPLDPITALAASSPLRSLGDITRKFSISNPLAWIGDINAQIASKGFQQWWNVAAKNRWGAAFADMARYPFWHLAYGQDRFPFPGTNKSYLHRAATIINESY